jgi:hypothetical protein
MAMPLTHRRFTVDEYHRMAETGILTPDDRVELLDGEIVEMSPIGPRHARCVDDLNRLFQRRAGEAAIVRVQNPIVIGTHHEPEPDIVLAAPRPDRFGDAHPGPRDVLLLVEVADASLIRDRLRKIPIYAQAGIPEVWVVNLPGNAIEVLREPDGHEYANRQVVDGDATLRPHLLPFLSIEASEILG